MASIAIVLLASLSACGDEEGDAHRGAGFTLVSSAGSYSSGGGMLGLAVLATLRDHAGRGPGEPWELRLFEESGDAEVVRLVYDDPSEGSYMGWWFSDLASRPGAHRVEARGPGVELIADLELPLAPVLPFPEPVLDDRVVRWGAVEGAGSYACHVYSGGLRVAGAGPMRETECDLGLLQEGAYTVAVRAFSADLVALAADHDSEPWLPPGFEVTEQQIGISTGEGGGHGLSAATGALAYGGAHLGLVLWVSLTGADGQPPTTSWELTLTGPGLPPGAPWRLVYPAGQRQILVWAYDIEAKPGSYTVSASSEDLQLVAGAGSPAGGGLELPTGVHAESVGGSGAASVAWDPVPGAKSYAVSIWTEGVAGSELVWWGWTSGQTVSTPPGTLADGLHHDVYVAAADVDMTAAPAPPGGRSVRMSENAYTPVPVVRR